MANKSKSRKKTAPRRKAPKKKSRKSTPRKKSRKPTPKRKSPKKKSRKPTPKKKSRKSSKKKSRKKATPKKKSRKKATPKRKSPKKKSRKPTPRKKSRKATPRKKSRKATPRKKASSDTDTALTIGQEKIGSISGPISFFLLKPKISYFKDLYDSSRVYAPVFMLLGDAHRSTTGMCKPCSCGINSCCYPIYSEDFLKSIDSIYENKFPIDFSIEGGISYKNKQSNRSGGEKADYPMTKLRGQIIVCYNKELRDKSVYKNNCPTKNIRWQLVDVRRRTKSYYNFDYFVHVIAIFFKRNTKEMVKEFKKLLKDIGYEYISLYIEQFKKFIKTQNPMDLYENEEIRENSIIFKQIRKMSKQQQKEWESYISKYYNMVLYNSELKGGKVTKKDFKEFGKYLDFLQIYFDEYSDRSKHDQKKYLEYIEDELDITNNDSGKIHNVMIYRISVASLDLYYLTRQFKQPKNDINPLLSVSFFGARHSKNIVYFLTEIMKSYDIVYETGRTIGDYNKIERRVKRCLKIEKDINLNDILDEYKKIVY